MLLYLIVGLILISGSVALVSFVLYAKARMKEDEKKEKLFLKIHFAALFFVFLLGIAYMLYMTETAD